MPGNTGSVPGSAPSLDGVACASSLQPPPLPWCPLVSLRCLGPALGTQGLTQSPVTAGPRSGWWSFLPPSAVSSSLSLRDSPPPPPDPVPHPPLPGTAPSLLSMPGPPRLYIPEHLWCYFRWYCLYRNSSSPVPCFSGAQRWYILVPSILSLALAFVKSKSLQCTFRAVSLESGRPSSI